MNYEQLFSHSSASDIPGIPGGQTTLRLLNQYHKIYWYLIGLFSETQASKASVEKWGVWWDSGKPSIHPWSHQESDEDGTLSIQPILWRKWRMTDMYKALDKQWEDSLTPVQKRQLVPWNTGLCSKRSQNAAPANLKWVIDCLEEQIADDLDKSIADDLDNKARTVWTSNLSNSSGIYAETIISCVTSG